MQTNIITCYQVPSELYYILPIIIHSLQDIMRHNHQPDRLATATRNIKRPVQMRWQSRSDRTITAKQPGTFLLSVEIRYVVLRI